MRMTFILATMSDSNDDDDENSTNQRDNDEEKLDPIDFKTFF